jgi:hypothetical protein
MNKKVSFSEDELIKYPIKDWVDGWVFRVLEISPNFYRIEGIDKMGRSISREGTELDLEKLIKTCMRDAREIGKSTTG